MIKETQMDLESIFKQLPSMTEQELTEIETRIFLIKSTLYQKNNNKEEAVFYDIMTSSLQNLLKTKYPPFPVFKKQTIYPKYKKAVDFLKQYLYTSLPEATERDKHRFYLLYMDILIENNKQVNFPISLKSCIYSYELFPSLLTMYFPGYGKSSLLKIVLSTSTSNKLK